MNAKSFQGFWPHMSLLSCCVYNVTLITCAADVRRWSCIGLERVYTSGSLDHLRVYKDILSWWFVIFSVTVRRTLHKHVPCRLMFTLRCCRGRSVSGQTLPPVGWEVHVPATSIFYLIYKPYLEVFGFFLLLYIGMMVLRRACGMCVFTVSARPRASRELCCIKCRASVFIGKNFQWVCLLFQSFSEC